ncbi:MAG: glutamate 5-kinase, partial [Actinobacteria bacterium]|nr:glutamate 5-kinase [Actinomycetota bacterium]
METHPPRLVVKCGTRLLTRQGALHAPFIATVAAQIAAVRRSGWQVVLVSSGAVASGRGILALPPDVGRTLVGRQMHAAIGQAPLMATYAQAFAAEGVVIAQTLLSRADLDNPVGCRNTREALEGLLAYGVVPIANENDVVATDELKFGDNDPLSALIANLVRADRLILLTTTDGIFTSDPRNDPAAWLVAEASAVPRDVLERYAGDPGSDGRGGMRSKIRAAQEAAASGIEVVVASGHAPDVLPRLLAGERLGTHFAPTGPARHVREFWLGSFHAQRGELHIDAGARKAVVEDGGSLLPAGVRDAQGDFKHGDVVGLVGPGGDTFARGLASYARDEILRIR